VDELLLEAVARRSIASKQRKIGIVVTAVGVVVLAAGVAMRAQAGHHELGVGLIGGGAGALTSGFAVLLF
jgi:hypothetical protein